MSVYPSFLEVKESISLSLGSSAITKSRNVESHNITLYTSIDGSKELPDAGFVSDHQIENDQVLYAVFRPENGPWESIDVVPNDDNNDPSQTTTTQQTTSSTLDTLQGGEAKE